MGCEQSKHYRIDTLQCTKKNQNNKLIKDLLVMFLQRSGDFPSGFVPLLSEWVTSDRLISQSMFPARAPWAGSLWKWEDVAAATWMPHHAINQCGFSSARTVGPFPTSLRQHSWVFLIWNHVGTFGCGQLVIKEVVGLNASFRMMISSLGKKDTEFRIVILLCSEATLNYMHLLPRMLAHPVMRRSVA